MNHPPNITTTHDDFTILLSHFAEPEQSGGMTSKEVAAQLGISRGRAVELLAQAAEHGLVRPVRKAHVDVSGRRTSVPAYVVEVRQ